jgi:hypothetical protein
MTVSLPALLADQLGTASAGVAVSLWPQIMALAREHLIPWIDQNVPELAGPARLAFHDLDIVADELRRVVRGSWRRLRVVLIGQTVQFGMASDGEWVIRITSRLRGPTAGDTPVVVLTTEERLCLEWLPEGVSVAGLNQFRSAAIDIAQVRDDLLAEAA